MDYQNYIKSELLILVPVLYIVGLGFKKSKIPDKWMTIYFGYHWDCFICCLGDSNY